jgi:hypothetical protein
LLISHAGEERGDRHNTIEIRLIPTLWKLLVSYIRKRGARGGVVVKALRYKSAGRGFDSRWCHWNFSVI